jgi:hypothetical protein
MTPQLISREIKVTVAGEIKTPASFSLEGQEYTISDILATWPDYGFGRNPSGNRKWWQRHHRNYFQVKTTGGDVFEIYYDRGANLNHPELRKWYVHRKL